MNIGGVEQTAWSRVQIFALQIRESILNFYIFLHIHARFLCTGYKINDTFYDDLKNKTILNNFLD